MSKDTIFMVILMFSIVLSGCAGVGTSAYDALELAPDVINEVHHGTTLYMIQQAIKGDIWTFIWHKPDTDLWLLGKVISERGIAFINIDSGSTIPLTLKGFIESTGGKGNLVSGSTFKSFLQFMRDNGWKPATAAELAVKAPKILELADVHNKLFWMRTPLMIIVTAPITLEELMFDRAYREVQIQ